MDGKMGVGRIESYRSNMRGGGKDPAVNGGRDCGVVDTCSPCYRSYLRAVRWLAEQCEQFFDGQLDYGVDRFIKDIMMAKIVPNDEDYVVLGPIGERHQIAPIWLEEKTARLIREVQHDFDSKNDAKYFGQFRTPCGRTLDQVRSQFYVDCYSESVQPHSHRNLKANTTECVPVPSSEHVAEIVGKKGGKIKNIRAETSTYIKTPKRDEEPVFVITGRKEDVALAKAKIMAAAEHFTQLREARRQNPGGGSPNLGPPRRDGDVTVPVEVPYEFVGLVVGQKGATIKRIQQDTGTYITTPSRRHRPIFEVVGQPSDVERAREAIQMHINTRVEKFREEAAMGGSCVDGVRPDSSLFFSERNHVDDFGSLGGCSDPFSSMQDANLGGTWTGVPPPSLSAPPPMQRFGAPPPPPPHPTTSLSGNTGLASSGGSRLSAFRNLGTDGLDSLESAFLSLGLDSDRRPDTRQWGQSSVDASWRHNGFPQETAVAGHGWRQEETSVATSLSSWLDTRGRATSVPAAAPAADPAYPPAARRGSDDARTMESLLFGRSGALGWDAALDLLPLRSKGSNETLNSDSGVDATTPPPLDSSVFGPIGSKRTSPTLLLSD